MHDRCLNLDTTVNIRAPIQFRVLETEMQETSVGWKPVYDAQLPSFAKVFLLYLALVFLLSVFRAVSLIRRLWWVKKTLPETPSQLTTAGQRASPTSEGAEARFQLVWDFVMPRRLR